MAVYRVIEQRTYEFEAEGEAQAREMVQQDEGLPVDALRARAVQRVTQVRQASTTEVQAADLDDALDGHVNIEPIGPRIY